jgi:hypothetical protein
MRFRKAFLFCAVLAGVAFVAVPAVMAAGPPTSCTAAAWTVMLTSGPTQSSCAAGSCVTYTYEVSGSVAPDHVAGLMPLALLNVTGDNPSGNQTYDAGVGDPVTLLGIGDMSREAFKVNPNGTVFHYNVILQGQSFAKGLVPVKIKKGRIEGGCALAGPVEAEVGPNPLATFVEDVEETLGGKCKVKAHTDKQTGETSVELIGSVGGANCTLERIEFGDVMISVNGQEDPLLFSEAFTFLVGSGTCAYKQYYPTTGPVFRVCW